MRTERQAPSQDRPRRVDRWQLASSTGRPIDGVWVGSWRTPEDLPRVEGALALIREHSPLHFSRIVRHLERIWIRLTPHGLAEYDHSLRACVFDERYVANPDTSIERIASTIVHEATHARLERWGIGYDEDRRARIEAICLRRELALAVRLPDGAQLREEIAHTLECYRDNHAYFADAQARERTAEGEVEMLRHVGFPDWLVRVLLGLRSLIGGIRRMLRLV